MVTGGGVLQSAAQAHMSVNAIQNSGSQGFAGKIEYHREAQGAINELIFHADVQCGDVSSDGMRAVTAGPMREKSDPANQADEGDWAVVTVWDMTDGPGDRVRFQIMSEGDALADCADADDNTVTPGTIISGNFQVRPAP